MADEQESESLKSADIWRTDPSIPSQGHQPSDSRNESKPFYKRVLPNRETRARIDRKFKDFFGLGEDDAQEQKKWLQRRACLLDKSKCKLKDGACKVAMSRGEAPRRPVQSVSYDVADGVTMVHTDGRDQADTKRNKYQKDSVLTMAWEGCKSLVRATAHKKPRQPLESIHSRSFRKSKKESAPQQERHDVGAEGETFFVVQDDIPREKVDVTDSGAMRGGRIPERVFRAATSGDQTDRRKLGRGFLGRIFDRQLKRVNSNVKEQMEKIYEHRPYFTYWVTFVQLVVYIVSVAVYGIAPIGFGVTDTKGLILKSSLAHEYVALKEVQNFWIGPRQADLIHLGAKYSPCMRRDENIVRLLAEDKVTERNTGCCINEVDNVCVQKSRAECAGVISSWVNCSDVKTAPPYCISRSFFRSNGPVCGLDPRHCEQPSAMFENVWVNDITSWPICKKTKPSLDKHMSCEITGRPCCVGIQGQCTMTTREHCSFLRGHFHEEAFLCSQVACLDDICGMIGFSHPDHPDQVYRLWLSLFLHAGLFHVILTIVFQMLIMRDVEKLAGAIRVATIYTISGIAGNLASATFLPYQVEAGPAGSQFGILAMLFVEVIQSWQMLASPGKEIGKLVGIVLVLFVLGLLPWIDNYAHLIGFFVGFLMSFALLPYVTFGSSDKRRKLIGVILSLVSVIAFLVLLMLLFYVVGVYECVGCSYFNCIPFTADFCRNMKVTLGRTQTYS